MFVILPSLTKLRLRSILSIWSSVPETCLAIKKRKIHCLVDFMEKLGHFVMLVQLTLGWVGRGMEGEGRENGLKS